MLISGMFSFPLLLSNNDIDMFFATATKTSKDKDELLREIISILQRNAKNEVLRSELAFWNLLAIFQGLDNCMDSDNETANGDEATSVHHLITKHPIISRLNALKIWLEKASKELGWPDEFELADTRFVPIPQESHRQDPTMMMDPDVFNRGTQLDNQDIHYESMLCESIFYLARQGRLEDATHFATKVGQPWRAAVLLGGMYSHDPRAIGSEGESVGNFDRLSWKTAIHSQCDLTKDPIEKALYGVLCGRLDAVHHMLSLSLDCANMSVMAG